VSNTLTSLHKKNEIVIYALVATHLLAILFYAIFHRDNLVGPMVTGYRKVTGRVPEAHAASRHGSTIVAVILLALAVGAVYLAVNSVKLFGPGQ
jgi:hypothetical protein